MFRILRLIGTISRAEFIMPNLGSLILGLAWGVNSTISLSTLVVLIVLSFTIINGSSAIGAQINTLSDYELDLKDSRKKNITDAVDAVGKKRIRYLLFIEFIITLALVVLFMYIQKNPWLLLMWVIGISLGWIYSAPPIRLKARSWLAPVSLILVLGIFPVLFAYFTFTTQIQPFFVLALIGLTMTIYGVIIPTEIRDYFGDKTMRIETMTVHLGLVKACVTCISLISIGAIFFITAYLLEWLNGSRPYLAVLLLIIPISVMYVITKIKKLLILSRQYTNSQGNVNLKEQIVDISAHNPQWIIIITQTYSFLSILLLLNKFI
ncbi:MAG: UbiA family prenyltransferase [Candidatus Thermoplasmatota archaeon]|nr:UbiA family prenyltransferase [Candidatus Thermoplasmatota archaeon]